MLCALIMAGGKGTRFWPKSTEEKPKQFLNLIGKKTMIQDTFSRINTQVPNNRIFVVTSEKYVNLLKEQLPNLPEKNIIIEPVGRNTAPCILLASLYINKIFPNTNIVVLPSDHIISDIGNFNNVIDTGNKYLKINKNSIITIGIKPNRPETGYGYIKYTQKVEHLNKMDVIKVEKFVEKPDIEKANEYIKEGKYLWNAGMFIFNVNHMLNEMKKNMKNSYETLKDLPSIESEEYKEELNKRYQRCEAISIDYAIMEKTNSIYVIPSDFGWDDIGTWKAIQRYIEPDIESNMVNGKAKIYNSHNNVVYAGDKEVVLIDIDNIFFIESEDLIIIGKKEKINEVHKYKEKLENEE